MLNMEKWKKKLWTNYGTGKMQIIRQWMNKSHLMVFFVIWIFQNCWIWPHCLNSVLKLGFFVTGVFDYLMQWLMLFKSCHLAPLCWETAKFEIIRYIFDRFGTQTKVWSQSCKTHISSKRKNTNLKQKTEMIVICVQTIFLQRKTL